MELKLPSQDDVVKAVAEPFDRVYQDAQELLLSALIPVDKTLFPDSKLINYVVDYEMCELCNFANAFRSQIEAADDSVHQNRIKLLIYCHIMEADFPYAVFWNLLRILNGKKCDWSLHKPKKKGKRYVLQYPREKIDAFKELSRKPDVAIGNTLEKIWKGDLRNSFSHSQYTWIEDNFIGTKPLSPLSRKDNDIHKNVKYSAEEIESLYQIVSLYLLKFIDAYNLAIASFKDGRVHKIQDGMIRWDGRGNWIWDSK